MARALSSSSDGDPGVPELQQDKASFYILAIHSWPRGRFSIGMERTAVAVKATTRVVPGDFKGLKALAEERDIRRSSF